MQKCKTYHYNVNGKNIEIEENLNVNRFISKGEFELAITPDNNDNDYDKLVSKLAVHMGVREKKSGKFIDLYFFKKATLGMIIIIFLSSCGTYQYSSGGNGCGAWFPKKFEKDKRAMRMAKESRWRNSHR